MNIFKYRNGCIVINPVLLFLFLTIWPLLLFSQTAISQHCSDQQSWIARWTIFSITSTGTTGNIAPIIADGNKSSYSDFPSGAPWTFDIEFGIVRKFTGLKIYSPAVAFAPHAYEIFVREDNISPFVSVKKGVLSPFSSVVTEQSIDFGGNYYEAKNIRIVFTDAYDANGAFATTNPLRIYEVNFFQCGVDPLTALPIKTAIVPTPALSCAEGVSGDIQGIINTYYPGLSDAIKGNTTLVADVSQARGATTHTLVAGDRILVIQMQNTLISETNSMAYGDGVDNDLIASGWKDVQNTGEYEFAIVDTVMGNTIQLTQPLQKSYSADGVFQVVYSPVYDNVIIRGSITAVPWDGTSGGIVTFDAKTLDLNNQTIDVSSLGFRKGKMNSNFDQQPISYYWATYCTDENRFFGEKGEGIAGAPKESYPTSKRKYSLANPQGTTGGAYGRGAPGNAGGGGNDHNSGGGGGANIGSGGQGGASYGATSTFSNPGDMTRYWSNITPEVFTSNGNGFFPNGGMGGTGSGTPDPFRVWMGGGGGGGHQNNNAATGGANGGGIILVTTRVVKGSGNFLANGENAAPTLFTNVLQGNDGAGGGGGGGTIVFGFNDQTGATINYSAIGGVGGDNMAKDAPHGPGGGGGGGAIIVSVYPSVIANMKVDGGRNGIHLLTNSPWGANKGQEGKVISSDKLSALFTYPCDHGDAPATFLDAAHQIKSDSPFLGVLQGDTDPMAMNKPLHDKDALGDDRTDKADEDGVEPFDVVSTSIANYKVHTLVSNPLNVNVYLCGWIDFNGNGQFEEKEKVTIPPSQLSGRQTLEWTNIPSDITGGVSYARFRISTGDQALQPTGVAPDGEVEDYTIYINATPKAVPDTVCTHSGLVASFFVVKNDNVNGDKLGTLSILTPPIHGTAVANNNNTPDDKTDDYIAYTPDPGFIGNDSLKYTITNNIGNSDVAKVLITVRDAITVDFIPQPDKGCTPLTVNFKNNSSDKTAQFTWDFGDGTANSNEIEPVHIFTTKDITSVYTVKLTMNTGCGIISISKQITVYPIPIAVIKETSDENKPEKVDFEDMTNGSVDRIWQLNGTTIGTAKTISYLFKEAGNYSIRLTAYNKDNCSDDTVIMHQTVFRDLYVPNAFMPNSQDTLINKFKPVGYGLREGSYSFMIFDLWGNLIWSTDKVKDKMPLEGWDGTKNGKPLPNDTYIWRIKAIFENNRVWKGMQIFKNGNLSGAYHTEGTVTILR